MDFAFDPLTIWDPRRRSTARPPSSNVDRNAAHSTAAVTFANISVGPEGTFAAGQAGNHIQGGFYGPWHAETAGVFERSNIVGGFGAKRQLRRSMQGNRRLETMPGPYGPYRCVAVLALSLGLSACGSGFADGTKGHGAATVPDRLLHLRASIDNLDAAVIRLLAERFRVTRDVGHLKAERALPPSDPQREARQIARLRRLAAEAGLDPDLAEKFHAFVVAEVIRNHEAVAASRPAVR